MTLQKWGQIYFSISAVRFGGINKSVPFFVPFFVPFSSVPFFVQESLAQNVKDSSLRSESE